MPSDMPPVQENEGTEQRPASDKISASESTRTRPLPPESAFYGALAAVEHPELEGHNLVELGMIPAIVQEPRHVRVTLALPFPNVPIRDDLVRQIHQAVDPLAAGAEVEVETVEMDEERRRDFLELARRRRRASPSQSEVGQLLAVLSGKGGVGKSSVTGLLASALQRRGLKAGILDADITGSSIPTLFGVSQRPRGSQEGLVPPETSTGIKLIAINLLLASRSRLVGPDPVRPAAGRDV
ncbi:MAG: P-loop NTPase [Gemmatimonadales bacterium]